MVKFNEDTYKCIVENHGKGLPIKDCADIAGIDRTTVYKWLDKGKVAKRGKYHDFYKAMQRARAKFKAHHLQKIANSESWTASQYLLQCVDPGTYVIANKQKIEADVNTDVTVNLLDKVKQKRKELNDLRSD